jgi:hypothetical protein
MPPAKSVYVQMGIIARTEVFASTDLIARNAAARVLLMTSRHWGQMPTIDGKLKRKAERACTLQRQMGNC